MTQYNHDTLTREAQDNPLRQPDVKRQIDLLHEQIEQQAKDIAMLAREVKRLKNEVRMAVNAFNLKNHG